MTKGAEDTAKPMEISIARRPVFDIHRRLWGYELLCVDGRHGSPAPFADDQEVAVSVAISSYMGLQMILEQGRTILVDFNEQSLLAQMPYALPPEGTGKWDSHCFPMHFSKSPTRFPFDSFPPVKWLGFIFSVPSSSKRPTLLGMFSLLDAMLGAPMPAIVAHLPLDNALKEALCGSTNSEYYPLLLLARALEEGRWKEGEMMMRQLNLNSEKTWAAFQQAVDWVGELSRLDDK